MNPAISKLLTATPEQRQEILSRLKPEELAQVFKELENIENSPTRRWYCTRETCDGRPHAGFHWCDHPIDSENHTPWCNHSRTPQRPPVEEPMNPWLVWFFSGSRGTGKTRAGAEWVLDLVWNQGYKRIALVGRTPADVRDVMIFGDSGIMSVSDPHPRPQHEPTKRRLVWPNGAQAFTYSAAAPSQLRGPQHDAAWCVAEGELVATHRGEIPIEQVQVGDSVWTRNGLRRVLATTLTNPCAEIMEIHDNEGRVLRCTPNHRVFVNGEWCLAENVTPSDTLVVWKSSSAHQHGNNGMEALGDYLKTGITKTKREASCTSACGNSTTVGESNQAKSSTTLTTTKATTTRQTCKSCHEQTTYDSTWTSVDTISLQTVPSAQTLYGKNASQKMSYANNAVPPIKASVCEQSFVAESVATNTCVSAVFRNGQTAAVYDLTVEGEHEFFASGILVHNCDELAAWTDAPKGDVLDTSWNNLMLGLRLPGHNPKCLVTTTPKRVKLVRQVMERKSTVITNGTTYENLHNMAAAFREQVLQAYEGTRIGRQELDGVLLTDVDGALWNLEMIDENRGRFVYSTRGGSDD